MTGDHVDLVERMESHTAVQMTRTDQIDLDDVTRLVGGRRRVRQALWRPPATLRSACRADAAHDPLDRAQGWHGGAELL